MKQYRRTGAKAVAWNTEEISSYDDSRKLCVHLTERQIAALLPVAMDQLGWSTRWFGPRSNFSIGEFATRTANALLSADRCRTTGAAPLPLDWYYNNAGELIIDIYEDCKMPVYVNVYEGCCPDDNTGKGNNSGDSSGFTGGDVDVSIPVSSSSSKCDIATSVVPYFVAQAKEFLQDVDTAIDQGATLIDAFLVTSTELIDPTGAAANLVEEVLELLTLQLDPLINALDDVDLVLQTQVNWWGRSGGGRKASFTRADAINLGRSLPVAWNLPSVTQVTSPRLFGEFIGRIANLNKLNAQLQLARGDSDVTLCQYLAAENGEEYTSPPPVPPFALPNTIPITVGSTNYELVKVSGVEKTFFPDQGEENISFFGFQDVAGLLAYVVTRDISGACGAGNEVAWVENTGTRDHQLSNLSTVTSNNWYYSGPASTVTAIETAIGANIATAIQDNSVFNANVVRTDASCLGTNGKLVLGDVFILKILP